MWCSPWCMKRPAAISWCPRSTRSPRDSFSSFPPGAGISPVQHPIHPRATRPGGNPQTHFNRPTANSFTGDVVTIRDLASSPLRTFTFSPPEFHLGRPILNTRAIFFLPGCDPSLRRRSGRVSSLLRAFPSPSMLPDEHHRNDDDEPASKVQARGPHSH